MLLAADIGNTNIGMGVFKGKKLLKKCAVQSGAKNYKKAMARALSPFKQSVDAIIVVSVVPELTAGFIKNAKDLFAGARVCLVGKDIEAPLINRYNKKEIGQDRLVTANAAAKIYGTPCLVIDFGTAVTFDAVSVKNEYLGGLIVPGMRMSLNSLFSGAALLPKVALKKTRSFIGRNTKASIINGMIYGYSGICEGMVRNFRKRLGKNMKVIATGGDALLISRYTRSLKKVDPNLSLKGLAYLLKNS